MTGSKESPNVTELIGRQNQFATLFDAFSPEELRGLKFCSSCKGLDYQWTDWSITRIDLIGLDIQTYEEDSDYRRYLVDTKCNDCDGTGFEGGNFEMTPEDWLKLAKYI